MFGAPQPAAGFGTFGAAAPQSPADPNPNTRPSTDPSNPSNPDVNISQSVTDCVSSLNFSPAPGSNLMVATSWSSDIFCWDVQATGQAVPKAQQKHDMPIMDSSWSPDGTKVFTAGCDKQVKMWDMGANSFTQIGQHAGPVRAVCAVNHPQAGLVVASGSWDKTVKYWDTRSPTPIASVDVGERVYALDARDRLMVVGTADVPAPAGLSRKISIFDIATAPQKAAKEEPSPLTYQTRCVAVFPSLGGYLVGSIEGRVGVQNFDTTSAGAQASFSFKCHRKAFQKDGRPLNTADKTASKVGVYDEVYAVNLLKFHPAGTFVTAGSDGVYIFWDKDAKARLCKPSEPCGQSITAGGFNSRGDLFAYASSYDWSQGYAHHDNTKATNSIYLHRMTEKEYQPRSKAGLTK